MCSAREAVQPSGLCVRAKKGYYKKICSSSLFVIVRGQNGHVWTKTIRCGIHFVNAVDTYDARYSSPDRGDEAQARNAATRFGGPTNGPLTS